MSWRSVGPKQLDELRSRRNLQPLQHFTQSFLDSVLGLLQLEGHELVRLSRQDAVDQHGFLGCEIPQHLQKVVVGLPARTGRFHEKVAQIENPKRRERKAYGKVIDK